MYIYIHTHMWDMNIHVFIYIYLFLLIYLSIYTFPFKYHYLYPFVNAWFSHLISEVIATSQILETIVRRSIFLEALGAAACLCWSDMCCSFLATPWVACARPLGHVVCAHGFLGFGAGYSRVVWAIDIHLAPALDATLLTFSLILTCTCDATLSPFSINLYMHVMLRC